MRIALATPRFAKSVDEAVATVERMVGEAAALGARVVCFPEAYLPGYRGLEWEVSEYGEALQERAWARVAEVARRERIGVVLGTEWVAVGADDTERRHLAAAVFGGDGSLLGVQTKNQLDPSEDQRYVPGSSRRMFEIEGLKFGVVIYFASVNYALRYPEGATCVIGPSGDCAARQPYGEEGVLTCDLDLTAATGLLAGRFAADRYRDAD